MKVLTRWFEDVWNQRDLDAFDQLLAPTAILHGIFDTEGRPVRDAPSCKRMLLEFPDSVVTDMHHEVQFEITEGDLSAARCIVTATHISQNFGESTLATPLHVAGMCMARIEDGQIIELWSHFDVESAYQQIENNTGNVSPISPRESKTNSKAAV